jgi:hypothetical protein
VRRRGTRADRRHRQTGNRRRERAITSGEPSLRDRCVTDGDGDDQKDKAVCDRPMSVPRPLQVRVWEMDPRALESRRSVLERARAERAPDAPCLLLRAGGTPRTAWSAQSPQEVCGLHTLRLAVRGLLYPSASTQTQRPHFTYRHFTRGTVGCLDSNQGIPTDPTSL